VTWKCGYLRIKKKVGPDNRKAITLYFRTANIFNSNFDRLQLCALLKQPIHQLFIKSIFEPNYYQYAKVPVYQDVVEPLLIVWQIDVGASKFLGMQSIFAEIFPNFPKKLWNFCRRSLWCDSQKMVFSCFSANLGSQFWSQTTWAPFRPDFHGFFLEIWGFCWNFQRFFQKNFQNYCQHFQGFCPDFQQFQTFGCALVHPRLLHHWFDIFISF